MSRTEVEIGGRKLSVSNLDKVLYPATGFTKADVIDYYARIADVMLPHLAGRPITFKRYPNGVEGQFFFEKNCPKHKPDWVETIPFRSERNAGFVQFCRIDETAALVWAANLAALELHPNLWVEREENGPTVMVFDLDPGAPADIVDCCDVALRLRTMLSALELNSYPKTSGSKGLQLYVPLNTPSTFEVTAAVALGLGQLLEKETPDKVVTNMQKDLRSNKVLVDWSQNNRVKTTVAVYSLRAKGRPTVSTPLRWDEVEAAAEHRRGADLEFEAPAVLARVEEHGDLFAGVLSDEQKLPEFQGS